MKEISPIELTAVFLEAEDKSVFGFISQMPEAAIGGDSIEEVERKLFDVLQDIIEIKNEMAEKEFSHFNPVHIYKKTYTFQPVVQKNVYETKGSTRRPIIKRLLHLQTEAKRRWNALFPQKGWS